MAAIDDLIHQIENPELRDRIRQEVDRMNKQKKFGLVFEEHLPECTPLFDVPVQKGSLVALKTGKVSENYIVLKLLKGKALCLPKKGGEPVELPVDNLVSVAEFGDPIYPYLQPIDTLSNAPDSDLWHTLIEADNYHALQLLEYLYAGKVDCIYIDPPYNTGARDWKYNNDYVDGNDTYRHSKWLSMMQKRLRIRCTQWSLLLHSHLDSYFYLYFPYALWSDRAYAQHIQCMYLLGFPSRQSCAGRCFFLALAFSFLLFVYALRFCFHLLRAETRHGTGKKGKNSLRGTGLSV